jgi:hypothetical protein
MGPLRHTDPRFTDSLREQYKELADAAIIFPFGYEEALRIDSLKHTAPPELQNLKCGGTSPGMTVNLRWIPASEWLEQIFPVKFDNALS